MIRIDQSNFKFVHIVLDSISRRHFYRKLPKVVNYLQNLRANYYVGDFLVHNIQGANSIQN